MSLPSHRRSRSDGGAAEPLYASDARPRASSQAAADAFEDTSKTLKTRKRRRLPVLVLILASIAAGVVLDELFGPFLRSAPPALADDDVVEAGPDDAIAFKDDATEDRRRRTDDAPRGMGVAPHVSLSTAMIDELRFLLGEDLSAVALERLIELGGDVDGAVSAHFASKRPPAEALLLRLDEALPTEALDEVFRNVVNKGSYSLISVGLSPSAQQMAAAAQMPLRQRVDGGGEDDDGADDLLRYPVAAVVVNGELRATPLQPKAFAQHRWLFGDDSSLLHLTPAGWLALDVWTRDEAEDARRRLDELEHQLRGAVLNSDFAKAAELQFKVKNAQRTLVILTSSRARQLHTLIVYEPKGTRNQQWRLNEDGTVESASCGRVLDARRDAETNVVHLFLSQKNGQTSQMWTLQPNRPDHDRDRANALS
ncbi:hypothetical protein M885DRAFT_613574 [Pelagophyceae sp. CCMP2097]|nr:hypothetical protein M885DRAFT_613574 [Pelagophyceae sp. CCMP2097]|mmetsp:Transcript_21349/g.73909  ORF Transcript_21349/g.73909 Transcript_21349/m.73909 type:complete len:425 (-) Transcript_21349:27-1301(-)